MTKARPRKSRSKVKAKSRPKKKTRVAGKRKPKARKPAPKKPKRAPRRRRPEPPVAPSSATGTVGDLVDALEYAQSISPVPLVLAAKNVQNRGKTRTPWLVVGRFTPGRPIMYDDLYAICKVWEASLELESAVGRQRLSRMRLDYTPKGGLRLEYTVSETAPWEMMISRAVYRTNPRIGDSLTANYGAENGATTVEAIYVWLSAQNATDAIVDLTKV